MSAPRILLRLAASGLAIGAASAAAQEPGPPPDSPSPRETAPQESAPQPETEAPAPGEPAAPATSAPAEDGLRGGEVQVEGGRLVYEAAGAGDPIVLIHGGGTDRRVWDVQFRDWSGAHSVLRYDRRGYGESSAPHASYSDVEDLDAVLRAAGIERAHLVGLSGGGGLAVDYALARPERVHTLVLVSSSLEGYRLSGHETQEIEAIYRAGREAGAAAGIALWVDKPGMFASDDEGYPPRVRLRELLAANAGVFTQPWHLRRPGLPADRLLPGLAAPTLVVSGKRDSPDNLELGAFLAASIPGAQEVRLEGAGHMVVLEQPEALDRRVHEFLAAHPIRPGEDS